MTLVALIIGIIFIVIGGIINTISGQGDGYKIIGGCIIGFATLSLLICGAARRYKGKTKQNNYTIIHEYEKTFSYAFSDCIGSPDIM